MKRLVGTWAGALALVLAAACGGAGSWPMNSASPVPSAASSQDASPTEQPTAPVSADAGGMSPPEDASALPPYTPGIWEERDNDGDGTADDIRYTFPVDQLTDDLTLNGTLLVEVREGLADAILTLRFENQGTEAIDHTYQLYVPKELAASVEDIEFSVPPTRVVDPDVKVEWDLKTQAGAFVIVEGVVAGLNHKRLPPVAIVFLFDVGLCAAKPGAERDACLLSVVREFRYAGELVDDPGFDFAKSLTWACDGIKGSEVLRTTCHALAGGIDECAVLTDFAERDLCQGYLIEADCEPTKAGRARDACLLEKGVAAGSLFACTVIEDPDARHLCEAAVNKSEASCAKISRSDLAEKCREALRTGGTVSPAWLTGDGATPAATATPAVIPVAKDTPEPSPPDGPDVDPCASADPNDPVCGLQNP